MWVHISKKITNVNENSQKCSRVKEMIKKISNKKGGSRIPHDSENREFEIEGGLNLAVNFGKIIL